MIPSCVAVESGPKPGPGDLQNRPFLRVPSPGNIANSTATQVETQHVLYGDGPKTGSPGGPILGLFGPGFGPSFEAKSTATQVETKDLPSQNGPHFEALFWGYPRGAYPGSLDPGMGPNPNGLGKQAQTP